MSGPPELAHKRPVLVLLTPLITQYLAGVLLKHYSPNLPYLLGVGVVMMVVYQPVISSLAANGLVEFLDQANWKDRGAPIDLRPVRQLADQDMVEEAIDRLRIELKERRGDYEAYVYLAKLCAHVNRVEEARLALLEAFEASRLPQQQEFVLRGYFDLKRHPLFAGARFTDGGQVPAGPMLLRRSLVLFRLPDLGETKSVDAGSYELQVADKTDVCGEVWWQVAGSEWGNTQTFWEAAARKPSRAGKG